MINLDVAQEVTQRFEEKGRILKGVGGLYSVMLDGGEVVECSLRGVFRRDGITPVAGDRVVVGFFEDDSKRIDQVIDRKNRLDRPPVANLDKLIIVTSLKKPRPHYLVIDKMTTIATIKNIEPIILVNKIDLGDSTGIVNIYKNAGFNVFKFNALESDLIEVERLKTAMHGCISAFSGNSGVGKSSIINALFPHLNLDTGEISAKLGRGRHTTRTTELFQLGNHAEAGFFVDTPGFSSLDFNTVILEANIDCVDLDNYFCDFAPYHNKCQFNNCSHISEQNCGVLSALERGDIEKSRYESYVSLYGDISKQTSWQ